MKLKSIVSISLTILSGCVIGSFALANNVFYDPQLLPYDGKAYTGVQDPEYISYDQALRDYMVKRIKQKFGVELDPKKYSGFDLLEIEAVLKCRKSDEPLDIFLKMFPKQQ
jgi:hypothetical protein